MLLGERRDPAIPLTPEEMLEESLRRKMFAVEILDTWTEYGVLEGRVAYNFRESRFETDKPILRILARIYKWHLPRDRWFDFLQWGMRWNYERLFVSELIAFIRNGAWARRRHLLTCLVKVI